MSGIIAAALAGLLLQQAAPHPSTLEPYRPPAVRPYEPTSNFGREQEAQGDDGGDLHRRPIEAPVPVDAYAGAYEYSPDDTEIAYDQAVTSAEMRADALAGPLDGRWTVTDEHGRALFGLAMSDPGEGKRVEGGWRGQGGRGGATLDGTALTLEGYGVLALERAGEGWRGVLTVEGHRHTVSLSRST